MVFNLPAFRGIIVSAQSTSGELPVNTALPLITGTPLVGETLSVSNGTWTNTPTSYTYQWKRDGEDIDGETENTYVLTEDDFNAMISCVVTATNAEGSGEAESVAVQGLPPLHALVLTLTSGTDDPPEWDLEFDDTVLEADYIQTQIDTVNTFDSGDLREEEQQLVWGGDGPMPIDWEINDGLTPDTPYYIRSRIRRFYGDINDYSSWSNTLTVTIAAPGITYAWNNMDYSSWSSNMSITGSHHEKATCSETDVPVSVRSNALFTSGKIYTEFLIERLTITTGGPSMLGVATLDYGNNEGDISGPFDSYGHVEETSGIAAYGNLYIANVYDSISPVMDNGDSIGFAFDIGVSDTKFYVWRNGSWDIGNPALGTGYKTLPHTAFKMLFRPLLYGAQTFSVTIKALDDVAANCPDGFTPAGSAV
ncbi:MAG: hypothetical protein WDN67_03045 [Candidatus Moraniibacteriota bacterium]